MGWGAAAGLAVGFYLVQVLFAMLVSDKVLGFTKLYAVLGGIWRTRLMFGAIDLPPGYGISLVFNTPLEITALIFAVIANHITLRLMRKRVDLP